MRAAGRRYQQGRQGRRRHAARQARYRQRRLLSAVEIEKVTHQGSLSPAVACTVDVTVESASLCTGGGEQEWDVSVWVVCDFCGARCAPFARREALGWRRRQPPSASARGFGFDRNTIPERRQER